MLVAAEAVLLAEAIADELAEADQRAGKLMTDLRALTFLLRLSGPVLGLAQAPAGYQGTPIDWAARLKALIAGE